MKINPLGRSDAISKYTNGLGSTSAKSSPSAAVSDSIELSEGAQKYSALMKAAKEAMERNDADEQFRAADILTRMKEGTYQVSSEDVVSDILSGYPSKG